MELGHKLLVERATTKMYDQDILSKIKLMVDKEKNINKGKKYENLVTAHKQTISLTNIKQFPN